MSDTRTDTPKLALITGASRGLGASLAEELATKGYHILAVARTVGGLEELDDRITAAGGSATLIPMDLSDANSAHKMAEAVSSRWGGLDFWAHCAIHAAPLSPVPQIDGKDWAKSALINIEVTRGLIALLEPLLRVRNGTALFFDDPRAGEKFFGAYGSSKSAQIALVKSWQAETAKIGPRVEIAQPDPMPTATRARFFPGEDRTALSPCKEVAARILAEL